MKISVFVLISFFFGILQAVCQSFKMEATIESVDEAGNYQIPVSPEISTHLKRDFSDLRIFDDKNNEVPYILKIEDAAASTESFRSYEIIEKNNIPDCCTQLVIRNAHKSKIDNISLIIKNADVRKKARLSGSDNKMEWYIIKEDYELESLFNNSKTEETKILYFPLSNYEYYRLEIDDSLSLPISILNAGYYNLSTSNTSWVELPAPRIFQTDSIDKKTYVRIEFQTPQHIDQLKFNISAPEYYLRNAKLYTRLQGKEKDSYNEINSFKLKSDHSNRFHFESLLMKELYLIIANKDNPPLIIKSIDALQLKRTLIAHLQKNKTYSLKFADNKVSIPDYDLRYFDEELVVHPKELKIHSVKRTDYEEGNSQDFFTTKLWIWVAIVGMILLLGYFSVKMVRDVKKTSM